MIDALYNGISGLSIYQKALNSESNNISNVNTVAFKSDKISFADMMYQNGFGKGGQVASISKDFTQGNMKITGNTYDMAIAGDGYFTVQNSTDSTFYTRAGNFKMGVDGTLQTANGLQVMGLSTDSPTTVGTNANITTFGSTHTNFLATQSISSDSQLQTINAKATDYQSSAKSSGTSGAGYKTASSKISDIEALSTEYRNKLSLYASNGDVGTSAVSQVTNSTFDVASINDANDTISLYIDGTKYLQSYDTDATTTLNKLSDQISSIKGFTSSVDTVTGALTVRSLVPGKSITIVDAKVNNESMTTTTTTAAVTGSGLAAVVAVRDALKTAVEAADAEFLEVTNNVSLANQGTLTLTSMQLKLDALNISDSAFGDISVEDGKLYMSQGDNKFIVGKVVTSVFNDNISLNPQGNNLYSKTTLSGDPIFAADMNEIKDKTLELSNSNLSEGLVNLMVYQKSFEANSKSITTSDDLLKTAIQLKK